jgi:hypothetical protein
MRRARRDGLGIKELEHVLDDRDHFLLLSRPSQRRPLAKEAGRGKERGNETFWSPKNQNNPAAAVPLLGTPRLVYTEL